MTRARNIAGFSTITTTPSPVHVGPIGVLTATRIDGEFNQVDLATRNITAAGIAATNLQVSGITTGLNVSGIITAQNGINFNGTSTGLNVSGVSTTVTLNATTLAVSGNASIGGVLTYEDVTRVDSVGVVTAREQVHVGTGVSIAAGGLNVTAGISTFGDDVQMTGTNPEFEMNAGGPRFRVPANNTLSIFTSGGLGATSNERLRIDSNGNIGAGTGDTTIDEALCVERAGNVTIMAECNASGSGANAAFRLKSADSSSDWYIQSGNVTSGALRFYDGNGSSEKLRITTDGAVLISTAGTRRNTKGSSQFQALLIEGTTNNTTRMTMIRSSNDDNGPEIQLVKTRGTSVGSVTKPNQNDYIGALVFIAADDSDLYARAAEISVQATGTPANDSCPSDIIFSTTSASASAPTTKMRITAGGRLGLGVDSPDELLHLKSTASGGACIELDNNGNYKSQLKTSSDALEIRGPQAINFYTGNNDGASSTKVIGLDNTGRLRMSGATTSAKISMNVSNGSTLGSSSDGIRINSGTPNAQFVRLGTSYSYHGVSGSGGASLLYSYDALRILADTSNEISFHTGAALRMKILGNGRVYMGSTSTDQYDQNKVVIFGTKAYSAGIVQQQLAIMDENAYNFTDNGGSIGFQAIYNSSGSHTQMACIQGIKENNTDGNYGGAFTISTRQNNGYMNEAIRIGSGGGPVSIRSQLYCNSELNLFKADATPSHKYMDMGYLNNNFYIRRTNGGDGGHVVHMSITSAGIISGNLNDTSDGKLKESIASIPDGSLALVKQLRPVTFDWKDPTHEDNQTGFIAQEIKAVIPNLVNGTEYNETEVNEKGQVISTGYNVNTIGIVAHLTKALQELSAKNDALEARIAALEGS